MRTVLLISLPALVAAVAIAVALPATSRTSGTIEVPFLKENDAAMSRMMDAMNIIPSGDTDRDFATMMIAHHRGATEMARAELGYGHNELLRRIAQGIVVEQQQEITAMRLALGPAALTPTRALCSISASRTPTSHAIVGGSLDGAP